jgi:hypothetical protein
LARPKSSKHLARQMVEGSLLSYRCVQSGLRGVTFSMWGLLVIGGIWLVVQIVKYASNAFQPSVPSRPEVRPGTGVYAALAFKESPLSLELAGREHGAADRRGQNKNSKVRRASTQLADIRRKLSNSRMRCSCAAFDTLLFATARESTDRLPALQSNGPVTDIEAPSPSRLGWTRRNEVSRSARHRLQPPKFPARWWLGAQQLRRPTLG